MNSIMLNNQQERRQVGHGKQRIGYAGVLGQDLGCTKLRFMSGHSG